ncbi:MAG TPA: penicillin acylase family protein [Gammaproteobacteria bacterium]|nr:penicillin acylase family protein [Gammaproteobacteria bacterium]
MNLEISRTMPHRNRRGLHAALCLGAALLLAGCSGSGTDDDSVVAPPPPDRVFAGDSGPVATIRRTTNGVAHISAENLESAAFGQGYAQAEDLVCYLADAFVKARSERAKYFGPGPGNIHIINDFSYLAQRIRSGAEADFAAMTDESRAMVLGFTAGYNKYVRETDPAELPPECRNGPWVTEIEPADLVAHYRIVAQYASGDLFATGAVFIAVPPGVDPTPVPVAAVEDSAIHDIFEQTPLLARQNAGAREDYVDTGLASNAWGIGSEMSENGRGALLANPHFPYTGVRRFFESQMTVPDFLNYRGAGLHGTPIPLIGFNENMGWSHTVSTSRRFTLYELTLKEGDPLTYIKAGEEKPITAETFEIEVNVGGPEPIKVQRKLYFSEYGPMLAADAVTSGGLPAWGGIGTKGVPAAYSYRDANADTNGLLDTWLRMGQARNLEEFQTVFKECRGTLWVNTTYADDQGNAFYIDSSSVPNLSPIALGVIEAKRAASPAYNALFNAGLTLLDGDNIRDDWVEGRCEQGLVPFDGKPKLVRSDFVQNSNDSYWSTNVAVPLEGFSPLYGPERSPLNPRTRIGLTMLQNPADPGFAARPPAGQDGKFGAQDLINVIHNNRSWYAEEFVDALRARCAAVGDGQVNLTGGGSRSVASACAVLATWDGVYEQDSVGAHVFRVFVVDYRNKFGSHLTVPFDPADPVSTPGMPAPVDPGDLANDPMLVSLADGLERLDQGGIAYDAPLGTIQVFQPSGGAPPGGVAVPLGPSFPWHGGNGSLDGAFNAIGVVTSPVAEDTRLPRVAPATIPQTAGLSATPGEGWLMARGTSWHFGLEFTDEGPVGYGLVSYSQSVDPDSPFFNDQNLRYSNKDFRQLYFDEADIAANLLPGGEITISEQ